MKKIMQEYLLSGICMVIFELVLLLTYCGVVSSNTWVYSPIEIWITGCDVADFFLPLMTSLPFSFILFGKKKNDFLKYAGIRVPLNTYIKQHIISSMIISGIGTYFAYMVALIISIKFMYHGSLSIDEHVYDYIWGCYQAENPIIFGLIWCLWKSFVASLFTLFGQELAIFVNNIFIVSITPFIYCMAENLVTALIGKPSCSIFTSFILDRLSPDVMYWWNYGIGVISYLVVTSLIILVIKNVQKVNCNEANDCIRGFKPGIK